MSEATVLESRVSKLEQDNRRLKLTVGVLLLLMAAVPLIGAVMPEQIPELVQARQFQVIDEDEIIRASMNIGGISYYDENRTIRARLTADGFFHWDENRESLALMSDDGIFYTDDNQTIRVEMDADGIRYLDENGTRRAQMSDRGIFYFDENGNTVWNTYCAPNC